MSLFICLGPEERLTVHGLMLERREKVEEVGAESAFANGPVSRLQGRPHPGRHEPQVSSGSTPAPGWLQNKSLAAPGFDYVPLKK